MERTKYISILLPYGRTKGFFCTEKYIVYFVDNFKPFVNEQLDWKSAFLYQ